jgi:phage tail protein X
VNWRILAASALLGLSACTTTQSQSSSATPTPTSVPAALETALPTRQPHPPGELVRYAAQRGDTLPAIAGHFNTSVEAILEANPSLAATSTTLRPGMQLSVPAYYLPLTGSPFKIMPDSEIVNGPSAIDFDVRVEILSRPGHLAEESDYAYQLERPAWEVVQVIADNYSIHPRLLLALLEYQSSALSDPFPTEQAASYPLGHQDARFRGLFRQLLWAAERLNDGYYGWRTGDLREFETLDGMLYRPDSWQNAGSVAIQNLFAGLYSASDLTTVLGPDGFYASFSELWGDPYSFEIELIPAQLEQPEMSLPFLPNRIWDFTGGPHFSWGTSLPWGALDFAPPASITGCSPSLEWATAPAPGIVTRSEEAIVVLDLDSDRDARTGWSLFYFHLDTRDRIAAGTAVQTGDLIGHPSCEGGRATGTHFHLARRFNGEWLPAAGPIPFELDGWVAANGEQPYEGTLMKGSKMVEACTCSTRENRILYELPGGS